jgi:hypothetical protein
MAASRTKDDEAREKLELAGVLAPTDEEIVAIVHLYNRIRRQLEQSGQLHQSNLDEVAAELTAMALMGGANLKARS